MYTHILLYTQSITHQPICTPPTHTITHAHIHTHIHIHTYTHTYTYTHLQEDQRGTVATLELEYTQANTLLQQVCWPLDTLARDVDLLTAEKEALEKRMMNVPTAGRRVWGWLGGVVWECVCV